MSTLKRKLSIALNSKGNKINKIINETSYCSSTLRLNKEHFNISCYELANFLLGNLIVRQIGNSILKGRIVETECYLGGEDKASHSYNNRRTPANEPMYMEAGTAYVYKIYGIYHCFNISSIEPGGAVLIRALEPIEGVDKMKELRNVSRFKETTVRELCKGPSKLCISMDITKEKCNKLNLYNNKYLWLEFDNDYSNLFHIIETTRIGISSAGEEWANKPFRFYIKGNVHVSKCDRRKEKELET